MKLKIFNLEDYDFILTGLNLNVNGFHNIDVITFIKNNHNRKSLFIFKQN
jgi:hypothetical protein